MNISLPPSLRSWVEDQVKVRGFGTASEFVRDMIRREKEKSFRLRVDQQIARALKTPLIEMTDAEWARIEREGLKLAKKRKTR